MRVLVACEFSGVVREAFARRGHDAWSCDILDTDVPGNHLKCDVTTVFGLGWDLMIAHPPCTHLAVSGSHKFAEKRADGRQQQGIDFFMQMVNAPIPKIAVENPVCIMSSVYRKPDQIVQPWMFGHMETKATCFWLKNLPKLVQTNNVYDEMVKLPKKERNRTHYMSPSKDRGKRRSVTFTGIAEAMAQQWG